MYSDWWRRQLCNIQSCEFGPPALKLDARRRADDMVCCTATDVGPHFAVLIPELKSLCRMVLI
jgi:hypothetical protein